MVFIFNLSIKEGAKMLDINKMVQDRLNQKQDMQDNLNRDYVALNELLVPVLTKLDKDVEAYRASRKLELLATIQGAKDTLEQSIKETKTNAKLLGHVLDDTQGKGKEETSIDPRHILEFVSVTFCQWAIDNYDSNVGLTFEQVMTSYYVNHKILKGHESGRMNWIARSKEDMGRDMDLFKQAKQDKK